MAPRLLLGAPLLAPLAAGQSRTETYKLLPDPAPSPPEFGRDVALWGSTAIVGARGELHGGNASGAAYVFDVRTGQRLHELIPGDGAGGDDFGMSVAIQGGTSVVGAFSTWSFQS